VSSPCAASAAPTSTSSPVTPTITTARKTGRRRRVRSLGSYCV
jgi:hypothetical protein